jgi:protein glucosyltransferase
MRDQINQDFSSQKPTSSQNLDSFFFSIPDPELSNVYQLVKVTIDQKGVHTFPETLSYFHGRRRAIVEGLRILHKLGLLHSCEFLLRTSDLVGHRYANQVPLFAFSKNISLPSHQNLILIPDGINMSKWGSIFKTIQFAGRAFPWDQKINKLYWRGSDTNPIRRALVALGKNFPFVDACLASGRNGIYSTPEEQIRYKYLISLDGISSTWPGLLWKLASNSLTLKQESAHIQWYYGALKPYVHYLPVTHNLSTLEKAYGHAQAHDDEMRTIASTAQEFIQKMFGIKICSYI